MKKSNSIFNTNEQRSDDVAISRAEVRRLGWHLENLKIVRIGRFQCNVDELVNGKNESGLRTISA